MKTLFTLCTLLSVVICYAMEPEKRRLVPAQDFAHIIADSTIERSVELLQTLIDTPADYIRAINRTLTMHSALHDLYNKEAETYITDEPITAAALGLDGTVLLSYKSPSVGILKNNKVTKVVLPQDIKEVRHISGTSDQIIVADDSSIYEVCNAKEVNKIYKMVNEHYRILVDTSGGYFGLYNSKTGSFKIRSLHHGSTRVEMIHLKKLIPTCMVFNRNGCVGVIGTNTGDIVQIYKDTLKYHLQYLTKPIVSVDISSDGTTGCAASGTHYVLWKLSNQEQPTLYQARYSNTPLISTRIQPRTNTLSCLFDKGRVVTVDINTRSGRLAYLRQLDNGDRMLSISYSTDGYTRLVASKNGVLCTQPLLELSPDQPLAATHIAALLINARRFGCNTIRTNLFYAQALAHTSQHFPVIYQSVNEILNSYKKPIT